MIKNNKPAPAWLALQLHRVAENRQLLVSSRPDQGFLVQIFLILLLLEKSRQELLLLSCPLLAKECQSSGCVLFLFFLRQI